MVKTPESGPKGSSQLPLNLPEKPGPVQKTVADHQADLHFPLEPSIGSAGEIKKHERFKIFQETGEIIKGKKP